MNKKASFTIKWELIEQNVGSTKWRLRWGWFWGSRLNLRWGKCGIWLVNQWVLVFFIAHWELMDIIGCILGYCIHLRYWCTDCDDWLSWLRLFDVMILSVFHCYIRLRHWYAGCIDQFSCIVWHSDPDFCLDCSDHLTCIDSLLYIIWLDVLIHLPIYYLSHLWVWRLYHYSSWL